MNRPHESKSSNERIEDAEEPKEESKVEPEVEPASEPKEEPEEEPMDKANEEPTGEDGGADADTKKATKPIPTGRGMRQRKSTQAYQPVVDNLKKERVIPNGNGEKLNDMPRVVANFKAITWSDPDLKSLYTIVFGMGKKKDFKNHLLEFSGLVYPAGKDVEAEQNKVKMKMYKLKMDGLKSVMDLADIDRSAESFGNKAPGKEELCIRFLEWLENPKASKKRGKRKSAQSARKGSAKKAKQKTSAKKTPEKTTAKVAASASAKRPASLQKDASPKRAKATKAVDLNIPGVDLAKLREKVKSIVEKANRKELTVKMVRKMLEDWLDTDLSKHKDAIRSLVMEVM